MLDENDADLLLAYVEAGAGRSDPIMEVLSRALVDFQTDGDIEQVRCEWLHVLLDVASLMWHAPFLPPPTPTPRSFLLLFRSL
jgi:hypothetical protein